MAIYLCIFIFIFILLSQGQGFYFYCVFFLLLSLPNSDPHLFSRHFFCPWTLYIQFLLWSPPLPPQGKSRTKQWSQVAMTIFPCSVNLLLFTLSHAGFFCPAKVVGQGCGKILAPHHGTGMSIDFLALPLITKGYNYKFFIP